MKQLRRQVFAVPESMYRKALKRAVRDALQEDIGKGDITSTALKLRGLRGQAVLLAKSDGILAGTDAFSECFRMLNRRVIIRWHNRNGDRIASKRKVATVTGDAAAILTAERIALNFVAHLSGIATVTANMVSRIPRGSARLLDTRKTTPGLRLLEKRATALGGAMNHRIGLYDAFMVKDNHIAAVGGVSRALILTARARRGRQLICEVANMEQVRVALNQGATWLLLDNFALVSLRAAVRVIRQWSANNNRRITIEASGRITPRRIAAVARTGVDYISSGFITHSAVPLDFSLEWSGHPARSPRRAL
jgi:nicotinate-nucleotide pyrophosphorylase (carboxylating)